MMKICDETDSVDGKSEEEKRWSRSRNSLFSLKIDSNPTGWKPHTRIRDRFKGPKEHNKPD